MLRLNRYLFIASVSLAIGCDLAPQDGGLLSDDSAPKGILDDPEEEQQSVITENAEEVAATEINEALGSSVFERVLAGSVTIHPLDRSGRKIAVASGVIIANNLIATNFHVVEKGVSFEITLNSTKEVLRTEKLFKVDEAHDVAIIELVHGSSNILAFSSTEPKIGDDVIVAGSPSGLEGTVSKGIVSSYRRAGIFDFDFIQIDAPISPGSSGGPVVNEEGKLIGISVGGLGEGNLNFAVPVKYIRRLLE
jgi:S1-C subfamily serine protease